MAIHKKNRELIHKKYNGHCAYCGKEISYKQMQVDHIHPVYNEGTDDIENLNPSCARCNKWKSTFTIEQFRHEIQEQVNRLNLRSSNYRMAKDFNLIQENNMQVKFYFETI